MPESVAKLISLRWCFGVDAAKEKLEILQKITLSDLRPKQVVHQYYLALLFTVAYPDNKVVHNQALSALYALQSYLKTTENLRYSLFNSGIAGTQQCVSYSFEVAQWLRALHREEVSLDSIEAADGTINSILSVLLPKVESEILQDGNADWKTWLLTYKAEAEDLLDCLIRIFDEAAIRPEIKDELWAALKINLTISLSTFPLLPTSLTQVYCHRSLIRHISVKQQKEVVRVSLKSDETKSLIDCGRKILVHHLREIDPITFSDATDVTYYHLARGISVALYGMRNERRHPIDSYMGYVAFKNGLPVAYAGSWVLFDSARIGLNVFPAYRGGESRVVFEEVLRLHRQVYRLHRFTVDPYQIGKDNKDGILSGAFWFYYHLGFRPIEEKQRKLAEAEQQKNQQQKHYRSTEKTLKLLAESRMELVWNQNAVNFDATDLSRVYAEIIKLKYRTNRQQSMEEVNIRMRKLLEIPLSGDNTLAFIISNWSVLLMENEKEIRKNSALRQQLKQLLQKKGQGNETEFILELQKSEELQLLLTKLVAKYLQ